MSLFPTSDSLRTATLLKKRLWHRCFFVSFAKFLRTPFLHNTSGWLLMIVTMVSIMITASVMKELKLSGVIQRLRKGIKGSSLKLKKRKPRWWWKLNKRNQTSKILSRFNNKKTCAHSNDYFWFMWKKVSPELPTFSDLFQTLHLTM